MADSKVSNPIDPVMEKAWQRAQRFERYDFWRKSAYPPMSIEPVPFERSRLAGEGMSPSIRALRKQWIQDQVLHHEAHVPEVQPYNIFRRIYRWPMDKLFYGPVKKVLGHGWAVVLRTTIPKVFLAYGASYLVWYHLKYNYRDWTRDSGVCYYGMKPMLFDREAAEYPNKEKTDFGDRGFKTRKALLYKKSDEAAPAPCH